MTTAGKDQQRHGLCMNRTTGVSGSTAMSPGVNLHICGGRAALCRAAMMALTMVGLLACQGDPSQREPDSYAHNPNPKEKYELTVKVENAPGPFKRVSATAVYTTKDCRYLADSFNRSFAYPFDTKDIELTPVSEVEWKGYFYADEMLDKDYGFGMCHWTVDGAGSSLRAAGEQNETLFSADAFSRYLFAHEGSSKHYIKSLYPRHPGQEPDAKVFVSTGKRERSWHGNHYDDSELFKIAISAKKVMP